jgi:hypothetical protein
MKTTPGAGEKPASGREMSAVRVSEPDGDGNRFILRVAAGAAALLLSACGTMDTTQSHNEWRQKRVESANQGMSDWANVTADAMVEKYGPPDRVETLRLVWENRGPWKKIMVWDGIGYFQNQDGGSNNLQEVIAYAVPADKRDDLLRFSRGIFVSPDGSELSSRSTGEDRNFLALNLADRIIKGELTPQDARVEYLHEIELAESGKSSPSMERLLFK